MQKLVRPHISSGVAVDEISIDSDEILECITANASTNVVVGDSEIEAMEITDAYLCGLSLTGISFENLSAVDVIFEDCELSGAMLFNSRLVRVEFLRCRLSGFVASCLSGRDVMFQACRIDESNFRMAKLQRVQFQDCDLRGSDFGSANFTDSAILASKLDGADFSQVVINNLDLFGSNLESVKGAASLGGVSISSDQVLPLAIPLLSSLGVKVVD